jgi:hypothetical protein
MPEDLVVGRIEFEQIGTDIGKLVAEKNAAYGDSFNKCGEFLKLLYPNGVKPEQYADMLALVRVFDKQMRIATDKDALGENPWRDVMGYALLAVARDKAQAGPPQRIVPSGGKPYNP